MAFENYLKEYNKIMQSVRKETYEKYPTETGMLFEFIDNWIDLIPRDKDKFFQATNSLSGIILLNSWKLNNWVSYEILCGKYFEAIRNLRFVFEGSVYAVILEEAIESKVFQKWGSLSSLPLKAEILKLWEECKKAKVYKKGRIKVTTVRKIVADFVNQNIDPTRSEQIGEYVEIYSAILSDKRLYFSTRKMIEECINFLKIDKKDVKKLKELWHRLSNYTHFSHLSLEAIYNDPEYCFVEKLNDTLLKQALTFYFQTLDFFYAVLAWRFTNLRGEIKKMCEWWKNSFNKTFEITEKILKSLLIED